MEKLEQEGERSKRTGFKLSVIMLDLDHFKTINDKYGHLIGDKVLKETAEIINRNIRSLDIVGRYGGEEFVVILPGCDKREATLIAKRIKNRIKSHQFPHGIKLTISGGVKQCNTEDSIDSIIKCVDKYLYNAKQKGRNQICVDEEKS